MNKMNVAFVLTIIVSLSSTDQARAQADGGSPSALKIRQVFNEKSKVVAEGPSGTVITGDEFVATFESQKQCLLKVVDVRDNLVTLDSEGCRYALEIRVGTPLEKSLLVETKPPLPKTEVAPTKPIEAAKEPADDSPPPAVREPRKKRVAVGVAYGLQSGAQGEGGSVSGYAGTFSSDLKYESGLTVSVELRATPENAWGFSLGIDYDYDRKFKSGSLTSGGTTVNLTSGSGPSKLSTLVLEANAIYRWDTFYIPFGLNYSQPKFTAADGYIGTSTTTGGLGAQLGFGWYANENLAIEFVSRASSMNLKTLSAGISTDYGNLTYTNVTLGIKGVF